MTAQLARSLLGSATSTLARPRFEGSNINTWLGFKHINYLVEDAVLQHFRNFGFPPHLLYDEHGLCLELVDLDTKIRTSFHIDDLVDAVVRPLPDDGTGQLALSVELHVLRDGERAKAATSAVRVQLRRDDVFTPVDGVPEELRRFTTDRISRPSSPVPAPVAATGTAQEVVARLTEGSNAYAWHRRVPYFYCHYTARLQMSGYLRQLEEVVDLFLADRGISIRALLDERRWIPVVTHSSVTILDEVEMEEDLYTVFTVENVFKNFTYTARMDTYAPRDGRLRHTATGRITHGYAEIVDRRRIRIAEFDQRVLDALAGAR